MEYRHLGASGFKVPVLSFGTGTFGGKGEFFEAWGATDVAEARAWSISASMRASRCSTAPTSIRGRVRGGPRRSDQGHARQGDHLDQGDVPFRRRPERRRLVALSSDPGGRSGAQAPADGSHRSVPAARFRCDDAGRRNLSTLDDLVRAGKIRYIGCSNFSGWHLMKSLAVADRYGFRATSRIRPITRWSAATTNGS